MLVERSDRILKSLPHPLPKIAGIKHSGYCLKTVNTTTWTTDQVLALMTSPLETLLSEAKQVHAAGNQAEVQKCMLLSVKTGGCPENCSYCSQSAHFKTSVSAEPLMDVDRVRQEAERAKELGATRFCMGAAWRKVPSGPRFDAVLEMIRSVAALDVEVCCTFGMANSEQLSAMKDAGLTAYNHNLDTSREFYGKIVSTRTYQDRLDTLSAAREAGVQVCCGGILGLGESMRDRAALLTELANMQPPPESVPINLLVPIEGTPLVNTQTVPFEEFLRVIATARILMPGSRVRLSAGRNTLTNAQQRQCFEVGANSVFIGERLLTAPNVDEETDQELLGGGVLPSEIAIEILRPADLQI